MAYESVGQKTDLLSRESRLIFLLLIFAWLEDNCCALEANDLREVLVPNQNRVVEGFPLK